MIKEILLRVAKIQKICQPFFAWLTELVSSFINKQPKTWAEMSFSRILAEP